MLVFELVTNAMPHPNKTSATLSNQLSCNTAQRWSDHHCVSLCACCCIRDGSLEMRSQRGLHLQGAASGSCFRQQQSRSACAAKSILASLSITREPTRGVLANTSSLARPQGGTAGYHLHPCIGDCCIHLAAVPAVLHALPPLRYVQSVCAGQFHLIDAIILEYAWHVWLWEMPDK